jgi:uncharacterized membrane protein YqjE
MSTSSGTDSTPLSGISSGQGPALEAPGSWHEALVALISCRIALIQHESQAAVRQGARSVIGLLLAAVAALFAWALLVTGGIGALVAATGWPWYWLAAGMAVVHGLLAGGCLLFVKSSWIPVFPFTRNEFRKDRQWLHALKSPRN